MTWENVYTSVKNFFKAGLSENGVISSKRGVLWYVALVLWTFVHIVVFSSATMTSERDLVINYDFWIIVSGTGMVLGEKFITKTTK